MKKFKMNKLMFLMWWWILIIATILLTFKFGLIGWFIVIGELTIGYHIYHQIR